MKTFICILGVLFVAVCVHCSGPHDEIKKAVDECKSELGLPDEKPSGSPNFDDPKMKCFEACIMKKMGKMENGKLVLEKHLEFAMKHMPGADDSMKEKITECVNTANEQSDECEVAYTMHKCAVEKIGIALPPLGH